MTRLKWSWVRNNKNFILITWRGTHTHHGDDTYLSTTLLQQSLFLFVCLRLDLFVDGRYNALVWISPPRPDSRRPLFGRTILWIDGNGEYFGCNRRSVILSTNLRMFHFVSVLHYRILVPPSGHWNPGRNRMLGGSLPAKENGVSSIKWCFLQGTDGNGIDWSGWWWKWNELRG